MDTKSCCFFKEQASGATSELMPKPASTVGIGQACSSTKKAFHCNQNRLVAEGGQGS